MMCYILQKLEIVKSYNLQVISIVLCKSLKVWIDIICKQNLSLVMLSKMKRWFEFCKPRPKQRQQRLNLQSEFMETKRKILASDPGSTNSNIKQRKKNYSQVRISQTRNKIKARLGPVCQTRTKNCLQFMVLFTAGIAKPKPKSCHLVTP